MKTVRDLLEGKGGAVYSVSPTATVYEALGLMAEKGIGAVLVLDGDRLVGILSERDIVRRLASYGAIALEHPVSAVMTGSVTTCKPDDEIAQLMWLMTQYRIRHVPVVTDGVMVGIVSIGDIVKHRLEELQRENDSLYQYMTGQS